MIISINNSVSLFKGMMVEGENFFFFRTKSGYNDKPKQKDKQNQQ